MSETITYEQLFDTLRREKSRDDLQKLEKNFFDQVRIFLSAKQDMIRAESSQGIGSLAAQRATIEYQNVKKILKELYERRERKIVTLAMHRTRTDAAIIDNDSLLPDEKMYLESLVHLMLQTREQVFSLLEMRDPIVVTPLPQYQPTYEREPMEHKQQSMDVEESNGDTYTQEEHTLSVRFVAPVPKFVGKDLRVFGPYEQGEQAVLPDEIAQILIRKGRAQEMDPE
jgi:DNA replication initiation complex subunit (GINS family)